jgi:sporulation protein YqfC
MFDLPAELLMGLPRISLAGRDDMFVENHQGIIECTQKRIRFQTSAGIIKVTGEKLVLKHVGAERLAIHGGIAAVEFPS